MARASVTETRELSLVPSAMPLVGRERELEHARAVLQDVVREGAGGRLLLIAGEPGIGKSRLARELVTLASPLTFRSLIGRCFEQYTTVPWFAFGEALSGAFAAAPSRLRTRLLKTRPELRVLLPDLVPTSQLAHGDDLQLRVFRAAEEFLRALAVEQPILLVLEDLQWADDASLGLLLHLGRSLAHLRMLIVGTYRDIDVSPDHPLSKTLGELRREQGGIEEVTLQGLSLWTTREFVGAFVGTRDVAGQFVNLVHTRTSGNPFFIGEVLKSVVEEGIDNTLGWSEEAEPPMSQLQLPSSVRAVVHQRVRRLPDATRSLLEMASVLGEEFDMRVLASMANETVERVLKILEPALARRLLQPSGSAPVQRLAFVHALAQQALYEALATHRARTLHARAAEVLQMVYGDRLQSAAELARHFRLAGDLDHARAFALRAGQHAVMQYAHVEAIANFEIACELAAYAGDDEQMAELQRLIADELHSLDRPAEALAAYDRALAVYERLGDALGQARMHRAIAWVHQLRFDLTSATPHLATALELWPPDAYNSEYAVLLLDAARAHGFATDFQRAEQLVSRGLQVAEDVGDTALEARAWLETAVLRGQQGIISPEIDEMRRAESLARSVQAWAVLLRVHLNRGGARLSTGDLEGYRRETRQALRIGEKFVQTRGPASYLAEACLLLGDWREGRKAAQIACAPGRILTPAHPAMLAWMEGDPVLALQLLRDAVDEARTSGAFQSMVQSLGLLADGALQLGRTQQAALAAWEAVEIVRERAYWGQLEYAYGPLAEALAWTDDDAVDDVLDETATLLDRYHIKRPLPQLLRARGVVLYRRGASTAAIDVLRSSAKEARSQRARIELGRTLACLEAVARATDLGVLADETADERAQIVRLVGPEVRALDWAREVPVLPAELPIRGKRRASPLTRREQEVAVLVARGLTNKQIAEALVIAEGTAGIHIDHILNKLGFHSRAQVAVWVADQAALPRNRPPE
jgi:DNA-binding NarL/FixJ family response regulator/energy-coupling factor transporter ATP-binding protein EcfA2